jgi:hypothetical protein
MGPRSGPIPRRASRAFVAIERAAGALITTRWPRADQRATSSASSG